LINSETLCHVFGFILSQEHNNTQIKDSSCSKIQKDIFINESLCVNRPCSSSDHFGCFYPGRKKLILVILLILNKSVPTTMPKIRRFKMHCVLNCDLAEIKYVR